jgi:hypothetical protein
MLTGQTKVKGYYERRRSCWSPVKNGLGLKQCILQIWHENAVCSAITDLGVLIRNNDEIFDVNLDGLTMSGVRSLRRSHGIVNKVLLLFMLSTR